MNSLIAVTIGDIKGIGIHILIDLWSKNKIRNFVIFSDHKIIKKYVYKIKEEENVTRVEKKFVETGKNDGNIIEVTSGLNESDEIVSDGIRKIVNNSKVIVLKK